MDEPAHAAALRLGGRPGPDLDARLGERGDRRLERGLVAELPARADEPVALAGHHEQAERPFVDPEPQAAVAGVRSGAETQDVHCKSPPGGRFGRFDDHVSE
jgi:hypothetical protein